MTPCADTRSDPFYASGGVGCLTFGVLRRAVVSAERAKRAGRLRNHHADSRNAPLGGICSRIHVHGQRAAMIRERVNQVGEREDAKCLPPQATKQDDASGIRRKHT